MRRYIVLLLVVGATAPVEAQVRAVAPLVLQLPASTRAMALGDAYPLASADNDAVFYHPGLIDAARGIGASLAIYDRAALVSASGATEFWSGGAAFGVQSLSYSAPTRVAGAFARGEAGLGDAGDVTAAELILTAAYGRSIKGFRTGLAGKYVETRVPGERDVTFAADLGIARRVGFVTAGFAARNVGRAPALEGEDVALPMTLTLGASTSTGLGPLDVSAAAALSRWEDGTLVPHAGLEVAYWPVSGRTFIGRVGVRYIDDSGVRPLTLGAGFVGDRLGIDYAMQQFDGSPAVHRVGLRVR